MRKSFGKRSFNKKPRKETYMVLQRCCPACRNKSGHEISKISMKLPITVKLAETYSIVCCDRCGNCFADTAASLQDYEEYYREHNFYGGGWQYNASTDTDYSIIERILDHTVKKDSPITDMGCGGGGLLSYLSKAGYSNLTGVDPSADSISAIREHGINGVIGSVYESPEIPVVADVVIMTMVLEHLLEPDTALCNICDNYLAEKGYVILTWPHFEDLIVDATPIMNNFNQEHINYFSFLTAQRLMRRMGFEEVEHHTGIGYYGGTMIQLSSIACYRKAAGLKDQTEELPVDQCTSRSIREYIRRAERKEEDVLLKIRELSNSKEEVVIWGSGAMCMHLMAVSELANCRIKCFVDNNRLRREQPAFGYPVEAPEILKDFDGTVVITAMLYADAIEKQIRDLGNSTCRIVK